MAGNLMDQVTILERMLGNSRSFDDLDASTVRAGLQRARRLINSNTPMSDIRTTLGLDRWTGLIQILQDLAYWEPDTGGEADIATWCERQWAETLQTFPHNVNSMQGLGQAWLLKSQPPLARIYCNEQSPPAANGSQKHRLGVSRPRPEPSESEDTARINSPDYVEARSLLRPALESLDRAVEEANLQGTVRGRLLEMTAEAYMSFGNVSHPRNNEIAYQKALRLLSRASGLEGFQLDRYLEDFLEDNLDYIQ